MGPAVLTRSTSPLLVVTPVAPAAQASAATAATVKPLASRNMTAAPAAVSEAAKVRVMVFATSQRSTVPAATTARSRAVIAPAPAGVCVTAPPELRRTVAVLAAPVLTALVRVIGPAELTKSTPPLLVVTPVAPAAQASAATAPTVKPLASRNITGAAAAVS